MSAGVHVPLDRALQLHDLVVPARAGHHRDHVVDYDGGGAPLRLDAFAGVAYHVGIDVRDRILDVVGTAVFGQRHGLPGEPFQGAVGPHVYHRVRAEHVPEPVVVREVLMGHHHERVVVALLDVPAPVGLESHEDVAEDDPGDRDLPVHGVEIAGRGAPSLLDPGPGGVGQLPVPPVVRFSVYEVQGPPAHLVLRDPLGIVGETGQEHIDQLPRGLRNRIPDVVSVVPHPAEEVDDAGEGVETGRASGVRRLGRVHVEQDRDPPLPLGGPTELGPHHRHVGYAVGPVRYGTVLAGTVLQLLGGARRHRDYLPVELRMGDVVRHLGRSQTGDVLRPPLVIGDGRHRLEHGHPVGCEEVVIADLLPVARGRDQRLGEAHGLDYRV